MITEFRLPVLIGSSCSKTSTSLGGEAGLIDAGMMEKGQACFNMIKSLIGSDLEYGYNFMRKDCGIANLAGYEMRSWESIEVDMDEVPDDC
jgi:hypothetical protein